MITIHGIKNCDTMKKAMKWLNENGVEYDFHDYKKSPVDSGTLQTWVEKVGWEILVNRRGTTWRKLPERDRSDINADKAVKLMAANNSLIKRPVLEINDELHVGFDPENYQSLF